MLWGIGIVLLILLGYYVSLIINPYAKCSRCHGKPRTQAWVFGYAHRMCTRCQGTGQEPRWGRKLFKMDKAN